MCISAMQVYLIKWTAESGQKVTFVLLQRLHACCGICSSMGGGGHVPSSH